MKFGLGNFGASEHFSGRQKKKEESWLEKANWSRVVNFYCMQMSLVMSLRFIFGDHWIDVPCSHHDVISLGLSPLNFRVIIHAFLPATADGSPVVGNTRTKQFRNKSVNTI